MIVERVIERALYGEVLLVFEGHSSKHKVIVMGSGIRDYQVPAERIARLLCLVDCTRIPCYADMVGLTVAGIKGVIQELVEDEAMRFALFKEIEGTCWRESFMEESNDMTAIVCSREVTEFLANRIR